MITVAVNQPIVNRFREVRPYMDLQHILVLAHRSTDYGFPGDHATMAGAVTAGLFLVNPLLGLVLLVFALLLALSKGLHWRSLPVRCTDWARPRRSSSAVGYVIVRKPLAFSITKLINTPLSLLITNNKE